MVNSFNICELEHGQIDEQTDKLNYEHFSIILYFYEIIKS